jgi:hypothetical protein
MMMAGEITSIKTAPDSGAIRDLGGVAVIMIVAMGLLAAGYNMRPKAQTAQAPTPAATTTTTGMAQTPGTANTTKPYQPANPATDTRAAPTGSDTGTGAENGSTGNPK